MNNCVDVKGERTAKVGISEGEFVVLKETSQGKHHGYASAWKDLPDNMKEALIKHNLAISKGKIL